MRLSNRAVNALGAKAPNSERVTSHINVERQMNLNVRVDPAASLSTAETSESKVDAYFSADIETDGPIPGEFSMLSFAIVYAGSFDGKTFERPSNYKRHFYKELAPISDKYEDEALLVNGLDRESLKKNGDDPKQAMEDAGNWIRRMAGNSKPVLVAYPLSFDWSWLYWYFIKYSRFGSPFEYSRCFDIKTAFAVKAGIPISNAGRSRLPKKLLPASRHTHHALDDATEQAEIFANVFEWIGRNEGTR